MASPANIRETLLGISKNRQTNAATASIAAEMVSVRKINTDIGVPVLNTENDANEIGGGNEFAQNVFKTNWEMAGKLEKFLTSEWAAIVMGFSLNGGVKTGTPPNYIYTSVPQVPVSAGIELPYFTIAHQIRPGGSDILDIAAIGCMMSGWQLSILSGPGRASAKLIADFVGTGKFANPSTITLPTQLAETQLSSASLALTLNGVDYVTSKKIQSLEATWNNNPLLARRFHPGSGTQSGAAIGSRVEFGDRAATLKFVADFESDSTELTAMLAGTEFTGVFSLTADAYNSLTLTYQRLRFAKVTPTDTNGIVSVTAECDVLWHPSNGLFTAVVDCLLDKVCEAP
jgi:hypothetical protein